MRAGKPTQSESTTSFERVEAGGPYILTPTHFAHHWRGPDGEKRDTGRIKVFPPYNEDKNAPDFQVDDRKRFAASLSFLVIDTDSSQVGREVESKWRLQDLVIDPLGQEWKWDANVDASKRSTPSRTLVAFGYDVESQDFLDWHKFVFDYMQKIVTTNPHLALPIPTEEDIAEWVDQYPDQLQDCDPDVGATKELVLMGLEALFIRDRPIIQARVEEYEAGGVKRSRVIWDSISDITDRMVTSYRESMEGNEKLLEIIARRTEARRENRAEAIEGATLGMPGYERVDDPQPDIPFGLDVPSRVEKDAIDSMYAHLLRLHEEADEAGKSAMIGEIGKALTTDGQGGDKTKRFTDLSFKLALEFYPVVAGRSGVDLSEHRMKADEFEAVKGAGGKLANWLVEPPDEPPDEQPDRPF